jgi:O-antigen/teichoic acid export membrane protein
MQGLAEESNACQRSPPFIKTDFLDEITASSGNKSKNWIFAIREAARSWYPPDLHICKVFADTPSCVPFWEDPSQIYMAQLFGRHGALGAAMLMTGSTYITYITGMLVSMLIARGIGPEAYGHYAYLVWMSGVVVLLCINGITGSAIRFVSECLGRQQPGEARDVHGWLAYVQYASQALVAVVFLIAMPWFKPAGWTMHIAWFAALVLISALSKADYLFHISVAKGYGRFVVEAVTTSSLGVAGLAITAVMAWTGAGLMAYLLLFAVISVAHLALTRAMMASQGLRARHEALKPELKSRLSGHLGWSVLLTAVGVLGNRSIETYLLNTHVGAAEVGYFSIAAALTRGGVDLLASGLSSVLLPAMAHAYGAGGLERVRNMFMDTARYYQAMGLLIAGVGCFWAEPMVMLIYGDRYHEVIGALRVMVLVGGLTLSNAAYSALLTATDHQRLRVGFSVLTVVITALAAITLVPQYGLNGALASVAISSFVVFFVIGFWILRVLHVSLPFKELTGMHAAAAISAGVLCGVLYYWNSWTAQFLAGVIYALSYLLLSLVLGAWTHQDLKQAVLICIKLRPLRFLVPLLQWATKRAPG